MASDGCIYCIPFCTSQVSSIDPFQALKTNLRNNMKEYTEVFWHHFSTDIARGSTIFLLYYSHIWGRKNVPNTGKSNGVE